MIVLVLELGAGISIFAYRTKLTAGFDKGLNQSIINYRSQSTASSADIDLIQSTVSETSKLDQSGTMVILIELIFVYLILQCNISTIGKLSYETIFKFTFDRK